jgi:F0F1-type ATP synthase delta subunit
MGIMVYMIIIQVAVLVVAVFVLRQILLRDTMKAVTKLREAEGELGKKEEQVRKRIEENETEFRRKSAEVQETLTKTRETMEKDMARSRDALMEEAKKARDRILEDATRNKEKMRQELAREASAKVLEDVGRVYEMVFSAEMGQKLDHAFLDELIAALDEMDGSSITVDADAIEIACSCPLDVAHKERLKALVVSKFNVNLDVRETVIPELIAGIKIKLGSLEIDGSLANRFREAVDQLKSEHI